MDSRARCRSTSASSAIRLTWLTPLRKLQICYWTAIGQRQAVRGKAEVGAAHLEERHVPTGVLLGLQRSDGYWYIPIVNLAWVGVEGGEEEVEIRIADANARFGEVVDVHVELLEQVAHGEGRWRGREDRGRFLWVEGLASRPEEGVWRNPPRACEGFGRSCARRARTRKAQRRAQRRSRR